MKILLTSVLALLCCTTAIADMTAAERFQLAQELRRDGRISEALQEIEERHRRLTENASDLIAEIGSSGRVHFISANCRAVLGYSSEELIGRAIRDRAVFDADLRQKLRDLELEADRFYHIGTGQSSDSLMWGNRHGILDALCEFAADRPNVLLELKTKSANVAYFLDRPVPANVVLSWSLNTPVVIRNEEHFTAGLEKRLAAARRVADAIQGRDVPCARRYRMPRCVEGNEPVFELARVRFCDGAGDGLV